MTSPFGPPALGRGVVCPPGRSLPAEMARWPRVRVDEQALAEPGPVAQRLGGLWQARQQVVVELGVDPAALREPQTCTAPPWELSPDFEFTRERLAYLVWSNNYDWRSEEPVWWHARRAERLGARRGHPSQGGDVVLADGRAVWCDGGPRRRHVEPDGIAILHREEIEAGGLRPDGQGRAAAKLAPDQLAAVEHLGGPARVIAPAGSGKTRVLTERLRHLLADRMVTPSTVTALAFNKRAADEMVKRTKGLSAHIRTLNSLGLALVNGMGGFGAGRTQRRVVEEGEVRRILEELVKVRRQRNADPLAPYLEALSVIRLGLVAPSQAEDLFPDAAGVAELFEQYRAVLAEHQLLDFDEQIYGAIELLLQDPGARLEAQRRCRHLLVDEFQDLTPAHLLLIRLVSAPTYDVFGVGDDDQVIYSYAGASPRFLIDYRRWFPGADLYDLQVNYRCPPAVVRAAVHLLSHNRQRIDKVIVAGRTPPAGREDGLVGGLVPADRSAPTAEAEQPSPSDRAGLEVVRVAPDREAEVVQEHLQRWADAGAAWSDMAVLGRVNAALLPIQVRLGEAGVPFQAALGPAVLARTGTRTALAYLRMATEPDHLSRADIADTVHRPSRRIARNVVELMTKRPVTSLRSLRGLASSLSGGDASKVAQYADDLAAVVEAARRGGTLEALRTVRTTVGLGGVMEVLDTSARELDRSAHGDDLVALEQVGALHPDPASFETWLRAALGRPGTPEGVVLATVHRTKGQEWPFVAVVGLADGLLPHRLATDDEEERRVFHVALTRAREQSLVMVSATDPSPFCAELDAPYDPANEGEASRPPGRKATPSGASQPGPARRGAAPSRRMADEPAGQGPAEPPLEALLERLKQWRRAEAGRAQVPAYVVLSDRHLEGIARARPASLEQLATCPGIGPVKLDRYGDELLAVIEAASAS